MTTGKNSLSYKKENVKEQHQPRVGIKTVAFAHEAQNAGEDAILFNSLTKPAPWAESGFDNPSGAELLALNLQAFAKNVTVISSIRGMIQKEEYIVKNTGIFFKNFTTELFEVFEVFVSDLLVSGNRLVDMKLIRVEGDLADTETDFAIGNEVDVNDEEIVVFRDGIQMFRSDNNDSSGTTGNYYYLDADGDGKSSVIRFFQAATGVEPILAASTGGRVDSPNVSTFQEIDKLAGQLDAIIPTVADLAGVPESDFRAGPNSVDLKNFGSRLITAENDIDALETFQAEVDQPNSPVVKNALNAGGNAPIYACRAWVNFDGTGTVAIRASGNVSSITDNGTGNYTVNFTTAMPSATGYAATYGSKWVDDGGAKSSVMESSVTSRNSSSLTVRTGRTDQTNFRDLSVVEIHITA